MDIDKLFIQLQKDPKSITKEQLIFVWEAFYKQNPIVYWIPYDEQEQFIRAKNRMRLFVGGNRIGKTESGIIEDISWCLGYRPYLPEDDPDYKTPMEPPVHGLITTESLGSEGSAKKIIEAKLDHLVPKEKLLSSKKNQQGVKVFWKFKNGSTLSVMSYEQDVEKFEGFNIHFWHGDEPPKQKIYGAISRGLVDYGGWAWITMTPVASEPFTIRLFENPKYFKIGPLPITANLKHFRKWLTYERAPCGGLKQENIDAFQSQLEESGLDPAEIEARLTGKFKFLSGRILPFDRKVHIVEPFEIRPHDGTMYIAIDPHDYKPWAVSFLVAHKNGNLYTVDELNIKGSLEEMNSAIQTTLSKWKMRPRIQLIDPQAIVQESDTENLIYKLFKASKNDPYPLKLTSASRGEAPKRQGIQLWRQEMNFDESKGQYPSWYVFDTCPHTVRQVNSWVYDDKHHAMKEDDDFCENHYRLMNIGPKYVTKQKTSQRKKNIIGIGTQ